MLYKVLLYTKTQQTTHPKTTNYAAHELQRNGFSLMTKDHVCGTPFLTNY